MNPSKDSVRSVTSPLTLYVVELTTASGRVCESYATYEEALGRVNQFPAHVLRGTPLIFQELPDGSQRLVREDGKPLQWHRFPEDRPKDPLDDAPLPVAQETPAPVEPGRPMFIHHRPDPGFQDGEGALPPLPLADEAPDP